MDIVKRRDGGRTTLGRARDQMDDLFGRFFEDWNWPLLRGAAAWWPAVDISEEDEEIVVQAELPGLTKDDFEISVQDNMLTISGEKKQTEEDRGENTYHVERRYGSFRRDFTLPAGVDVEKVDARYHDGVLTIKLPKTEQARAKRIEVKSS